jgi:hypothetical protein
MRKGEIPIPHIVALLLAVVVIALVGYWLFITYGPANPSGHSASCQSYAMVYCNTWQARGYTKNTDETPVVGYFKEEYPDCQDYATNMIPPFSGTDAVSELRACNALTGGTGTLGGTSGGGGTVTSVYCDPDLYICPP